MTKRISIRNITLTLVVIASFFASDLAIAYDHHDLDHPPLSACPICAVSQVLSSADSFSHSPAVIPSPCVITSLLPTEEIDSLHSIHFTYLNDRAPPTAITA